MTTSSRERRAQRDVGARLFHARASCVAAHDAPHIPHIGVDALARANDESISVKSLAAI
ncbi:hypothetical protein [Paraburkholderia acidisoli]|uniref:Uncharacterized protein n=1 Tax=Paraburkholderia acidisoli TaxID=2571748 RepID=A0A7Z2GN87_9BURK|nr:hypothetical protein [Paraburkholderia acidisoli]QGZ64828.1 hypothetical protein FAZ98_23715 [Paraburkholderia acidisoli]